MHCGLDRGTLHLPWLLRAKTDGTRISNRAIDNPTKGVISYQKLSRTEFFKIKEFVLLSHAIIWYFVNRFQAVRLEDYTTEFAINAGN